MAERYESHEDYVAKLEAAANRLVKEKLLLSSDANAIVERGKNLQWPPEPTNRWPFWKMRD